MHSVASIIDYMVKTMTHLFCFGFGYTAQTLAEIASTTFDTISGDVAHILISIPPNENGDPVFQKFVTQISNLSKLKWVGYLSTTGVYGNTDGAWVDESSPTHPTSDLSSNRLKAEEQWLSALDAHKIPSHIFRLAGIYGPSRNNIEQARTGSLQIINKPNQVFSRIHVEDISQLLLSSINSPHAGEIYNACDDYPCNPLEVSEFCYKLVGRTPPKHIAFEDADLSPMAKLFYSQSRRVDNTKAKKTLNWQPKFPSYKEGLLDCLSMTHTKTL